MRASQNHRYRAAFEICFVQGRTAICSRLRRRHGRPAFGRPGSNPTCHIYPALSNCSATLWEFGTACAFLAMRFSSSRPAMSSGCSITNAYPLTSASETQGCWRCTTEARKPTVLPREIEAFTLVASSTLLSRLSDHGRGPNRLCDVPSGLSDEI